MTDPWMEWDTHVGLVRHHTITDGNERIIVP